MANWKGGEFGREWIHVYMWLSPFAFHLKLSQHCLLIGYTPTQKILKKGREEKEVSFRDFPHGPMIKTSPSNAGDMGLIPDRGAKIPHVLGPKYQNIK